MQNTINRLAIAALLLNSLLSASTTLAGGGASFSLTDTYVENARTFNMDEERCFARALEVIKRVYSEHTNIAVKLEQMNRNLQIRIADKHEIDSDEAGIITYPFKGDQRIYLNEEFICQAPVSRLATQERIKEYKLSAATMKQFKVNETMDSIRLATYLVWFYRASTLDRLRAAYVGVNEPAMDAELAFLTKLQMQKFGDIQREVQDEIRTFKDLELHYGQ